jgi:hypothetical protein
MTITPTTELEAVNECLENIGQAPVSTISGDLGVDTQTALNQVRKITRQLQAKGWYFNTEYNYPLTPNGDGDIIPPSNTLSIRTDTTDRSKDLVQRGSRMYDRENRTYTFTDTVRFRIIVGLPFDELPEPARRYISLKAARIFQNRLESDDSQQDTRDELDALADLKADDCINDNHNVLTDNLDTYLTLNRTGY